MEGEFFHIAAQIAERASDGGISVNEIGEMVSLRDDEVNCYPGVPSNHCHSISYFFALQGKLAKGKGHYNFAQILDEFIKHMQGRCHGITSHAVIITNAWWHDHYEKWYDNIEVIKRDGVYVEAYLIGIGKRISKVDI
jgi:hypothetical protein